MRLITTALLIFTALHAQAANVEWPVDWKAGDKAIYEVERCRKSVTDGKPANACINGQLQIEVLRVDEKGSLQRWKADTVIDGLANSGMPAELSASVSRALNLAMDIEFDDLALPVRLVNAQEIRDLLNTVLDGMLSVDRGGKPLDPKAAAAVRALMSKATDSDENLLALVSRDASVLYSPLGGIFPLGETMRVRSSMPSPFGTAPIESTLAITAVSSVSDGPDLELKLEEDFDRASFAEATESLVKPLIEAAGRPEAAAEMKKAMESLTLRRLSDYKVRSGSPWAVQVQWRQILEAGSQEKVDSIEFKRLR